jgi:hypothetical protein
LNGSNVILSGQSVTLTSTDAAAHVWSTGDTTSFITVSTPGTYWVRSYVKPGCYSTSSPVTIYLAPARSALVRSDDPLLMVYPNPAHAGFRIVFHAVSTEELLMFVSDATGRILFSRTVTSTEGKNIVEQDVNNWAPGIYWVTLAGPSAGSRTVRLVVE